MTNNPVTLLVLIAVSAYVIKLWWDDYRNTRHGKPNEKALPGAVPAPTPAYVVAGVGSVVILAAETGGEIALGVSEQQSNITVLFALYTLCAAFVEEIIFRGYIVIEGKGSGIRWLGVFAASILFAALHPFLWDWKDGAIAWNLGVKGWFSTVTVFVTSLWFYTVRFAAFNPQQSLGPCFAGHLAKNLGVIAIKAIQGHVVGLY